ncbi:MAG: HupE/UreJ family protein, partial [Thermoanaerobaculia bacterium]
MTGRSPLGRLATALLLALAGAAPARAHQFAPGLLEVDELSANEASVRWKQPAVRVQGSQLRPVLPVECEGIGEPVVRTEGSGIRASWRMRCPGGLSGKSVGVEGIASSQADVLLRITLRDGRRIRHVLKAEAPSFRIDADSSRTGVVKDYAELGVQHILRGWDHLLFVLALVLLIGWGRSLAWTITSFTAGHSVTLALASLGVVHVPQAPIEAAIALSIYFLAVELTSVRKDIPTLTQRAPWAVAAGFGLLHGLGFAGALAEVGLPTAEIPLALFSFNVGIELGQLAFVGAVLLVAVALRRLPVAWPRWSKPA